MLDNERFYSTIINLKVGELNQAAILKDVQRHPAKNAIVHVDLQRVLDDEKIRITIPLHFKGEAGSPGVKKGGLVSHLRNEIEVTCLPKDLPEFIEVDLSGVDINQMVYLADLPVPAGVEIPELTHGRNSPVASIHHAKAEVEPEAATAEAAAGAAPAAAPAAAAAAKPAEAKKDAKK
jgi:large subunit ribosomal protein L25